MYLFIYYVCVLSCFSCVQLLRPHGLQPTRLLCPWDSQGNNTGVGCYALLQGNLPDSGIEPVSPVAPALQADSLPLSHRGSLYLFTTMEYKLHWKQVLKIKGLRISWQSSSQDSALSLSGPGFNPWSGNQNPAGCVAWPKGKKKKKKDRYYIKYTNGE